MPTELDKDREDPPAGAPRINNSNNIRPIHTACRWTKTTEDTTRVSHVMMMNNSVGDEPLTRDTMVRVGVELVLLFEIVHPDFAVDCWASADACVYVLTASGCIPFCLKVHSCPSICVVVDCK